MGRRDATTEEQFNHYAETKTRLKDRIRSVDEQLRERASLYRRLRLPAIPDRQAEILRCLPLVRARPPMDGAAQVVVV